MLCAITRIAFSTHLPLSSASSVRAVSMKCSDCSRWLSLCETAHPPLGWVLSPGARDAIEAYLGNCANPGAIDQVRAAFAGVSPATD